MRVVAYKRFSVSLPDENPDGLVEFRINGYLVQINQKRLEELSRREFWIVSEENVQGQIFEPRDWRSRFLGVCVQSPDPSKKALIILSLKRLFSSLETFKLEIVATLAHEIEHIGQKHGVLETVWWFLSAPPLKISRKLTKWTHQQRKNTIRFLALSLVSIPLLILTSPMEWTDRRVYRNSKAEKEAREFSKKISIDNKWLECVKIEEIYKLK